MNGLDGYCMQGDDNIYLSICQMILSLDIKHVSLHSYELVPQDIFIDVQPLDSVSISLELVIYT